MTNAKMVTVLSEMTKSEELSGQREAEGETEENVAKSVVAEATEEIVDAEVVVAEVRENQWTKLNTKRT